jgi:hypothetical protein
MKTYAVIMDGAAQLHLAPENTFEERLLRDFSEIAEVVMVYHGVEFYETNGGFIRGTEFGGKGLTLTRGIRKN